MCLVPCGDGELSSEQSAFVEPLSMSLRSGDVVRVVGRGAVM